MTPWLQMGALQPLGPQLVQFLALALACQMPRTSDFLVCGKTADCVGKELGTLFCPVW